MIDPTRVTDFNLSHPELEERLIWWVFAAGHNGHSTARGVDRFLTALYAKTGESTPFRALRAADPWWKVIRLLARSGLGCWRKKQRALREFACPEVVIGKPLDLRTVSVEDLEKFYQVGMKTARCFVMHSRPGQRLAGLDTHIRKYMRARGSDIPGGSLSRNRYLAYEREWLALCDREGKEPHTLDLEAWNMYQVTKLT